MGFQWSRRLYRLLLRVYPHEFRDRFGDDLERDFADLLATRGRRAAWRTVAPDLARSLPGTYAHVAPSRRRRRLFYPPGAEERIIRFQLDCEFRRARLASGPPGR